MFEVNEEIIAVCKDAFNKFVGTGLYIGLFLMSIIYIISYMKRSDKTENKIRVVLGIYSVIIIILNLSPLFTKMMVKILAEDVTYWRVYWLLPIGICIAFMFTKLISKKEKLFEKIFSFIIITFVVIISGTYMYNTTDNEKFVKVGNYYKIPDNVLDIVQHVSNEDTNYKKIAGSEAFLIYTRQIDGKILLSEERNVFGEYGEDSIVNLIKNKNLKAICDYCISRKCNYLILDNSIQFPMEYLLAYDIKGIHQNDEYTLYQFNRILGEND